MYQEYMTKIKVGEKEYELLLTTKATKEIAGRYGGLETMWLIKLLANQPILIHNLKHKDDKQELLTEEEVELLTSPMDLAEYKDAITDALLKATKRNIESETDSKNAVAG